MSFCCPEVSRKIFRVNMKSKGKLAAHRMKIKVIVLENAF